MFGSQLWAEVLVRDWGTHCLELVQEQGAYGEPPASLRALVTIVTSVVITQEVSSKMERMMWARFRHGGGMVWWKRTYHFMMNREQRERGISEGQGRMEPQTRSCDPLPPARPTPASCQSCYDILSPTEWAMSSWTWGRLSSVS